MTAQGSRWPRLVPRWAAHEYLIRLGVVALLVVLFWTERLALTHGAVAWAGILLMLAIAVASKSGLRRNSLLWPKGSPVGITVVEFIAISLLVYGTGPAAGALFPLYLAPLLLGAGRFRDLEMPLLAVLACIFCTNASLPALVSGPMVWVHVARCFLLLTVASSVHSLMKDIPSPGHERGPAVQVQEPLT